MAIARKKAATVAIDFGAHALEMFESALDEQTVGDEADTDGAGAKAEPFHGAQPSFAAERAHGDAPALVDPAAKTIRLD